MPRTQFSSLRRFLIRILVCFAATPALAGKPTPPSPAPPVRYGITWINTAGQYEDIRLYETNPLGTTVVGTATMGGVSTAVKIDVATPNVVVDLHSVVPVPTGWHLNSARDINSSGRIAGLVTDNDGILRAYVYDPLDMDTPFQPIGGGDVDHDVVFQWRDMNDAGDVLYFENDGTVKFYVYTHDDKRSHQLRPEVHTAGGWGPSGPIAINNDRLIAGNYVGGSDETAYIYDYTDDTFTAIPPYFRSLEINNEGTVVGRGGSLKGKNTQYVKAVTFNSQDGKKQLTEQISTATAVNDYGQVSGQIQNVSGGPNIPDSAFIYDPDDKFWSITNLLQDSTQDVALWTSIDGAFQGPTVGAISEPLVAGGYPLIVGDKLVPATMFADGIQRRLGFILTPISGGTVTALAAGSVPEPTSLFLLAVGLLPLYSARHWRTIN